MHRSRLFVLPSVYCLMPYNWHTWHYILRYCPRRSASTPPFFREQAYLISVRTFLSVSQIEASFFSVPSPLRSTVAQSILSLLSFALHCKSHLPNQPFLFLSDQLSLLLLYRIHSLSPFKPSDAVFHPFCNLSLSISACLIQPEQNEQQHL